MGKNKRRQALHWGGVEHRSICLFFSIEHCKLTESWRKASLKLPVGRKPFGKWKGSDFGPSVLRKKPRHRMAKKALPCRNLSRRFLFLRNRRKSPLARSKTSP